MANMRQGTVDLVFADAPFNLGKCYEDPGVSDQIQTEFYRGWCRTWMLRPYEYYVRVERFSSITGPSG
jgi:hypothetical protein